MRDDRFRRTEKILYSYKTIKAQLEADMACHSALISDGYRSPDYSVERVTSSNVGDIVAAEVLRAAEKKAELSNRIAIAKNYVDKIETALKYMNSIERRIFELKYLGRNRDCYVYMKLIDYISSATYYRLKNDMVQRFGLMLWGVDESEL